MKREGQVTFKSLDRKDQIKGDHDSFYVIFKTILQVARQ